MLRGVLQRFLFFTAAIISVEEFAFASVRWFVCLQDYTKNYACVYVKLLDWVCVETRMID